MSIPVFGPAAGGAHPFVGADLLESRPQVVGRDSRQVGGRHLPNHESGEHGVRSKIPPVGLVAGVGTGVGPPAVPGAVGVGVLAV